ncbi:MAG: PHP domain-containing protein, partial [Hyphomicrobium sp.]
MAAPQTNASAKFVHLKVHSAYSLLEGALPIGKLAKLAVGYGFPAIAITDSNNLFGALDFSNKLWDSGVQPIVGCSIDVDFADHRESRDMRLSRPGSNEPRAQTAGKITLLAMNGDGYANLMRLSKCLYFEPAPDET